MKRNDILANVTATVTERPVYTLTIEIKNHPQVKKRSLLDGLLRRELPAVEKIREFVLRPLTVGNMYRIAGRSAILPESVIEGSLSQAVLPLIKDHLEDVVYIVAVGIQNDRNEPSEELLTFIRDNFDAQDVYDALLPVLENTGMQSFLNSIALAKGTVKILEPNASPSDGSE